jgi:hypothetical protein
MKNPNAIETAEFFDISAFQSAIFNRKSTILQVPHTSPLLDTSTPFYATSHSPVNTNKKRLSKAVIVIKI